MFGYKWLDYEDLKILKLYSKDTYIWIAPSVGANMCKFSYLSKNVIDFTYDDLVNDFSGNPILYPTPNRVKNGEFVYNNKAYVQQKKSGRVLTHGLLYNEEFVCLEPVINKDCISVKLYFDFNKECEFFDAFPFESRFNIEYTLYNDRVMCRYTVENFSNEKIPFGMAFHPYFIKLDGDNHTYVKVPFNKYFENTPELFPTTKLIPVENDIRDIRKFRPFSELELDDVYTESTGEFLCIWYKKSKFKVVLECSDDFENAILYCPKGESFFCLENQTCSTNAHNLYAQGYEKLSGLKFVEPKKEFFGYVCYRIEKE